MIVVSGIPPLRTGENKTHASKTCMLIVIVSYKQYSFYLVIIQWVCVIEEQVMRQCPM